MITLLTFNRPHAPKLATAIFLSAGSLSAAMGLLATSAWLISEASTRPPVLTLEVAIVAVRTFGLSRGLLKYVSRIIEHDVALRTQIDLRIRIYENLRLTPALHFGALRRSQMMQQLVADVDTSQDLWLRLWSPWFSALITGVAGIGIMYALLPSYSYWLAVLFLVAITSAPVVAYLSGSSADIRNKESELFDRVMQSFESVDESLIFGYQADLMNEVTHQQRNIARLDKRAARWAGVASAGYAKTLGIALVLGVLYASHAFYHHDLIGINVAVVILLPLAIFDGVSSLPLAFARALKVKESINAIEPLLVPPTSELQIPHSKRGSSLVIKELSPQIPNKALPTFSGEASPNNPWIITGASGYGKSSLLYALLGFFQYSGQITVDGEPISSLSPDNTTTLLQDDHLFVTSIRENLKIAKPEATDQELIDVLQLVELDVLLRTLPDGLDTLIGEAGFNFSGGEKQRIKLARVLLRDSDIYLLDEPFEYIGMAQAARLSQMLLSRLSNKTLVIVSHLPIQA